MIINTVEIRESATTCRRNTGLLLMCCFGLVLGLLAPAPSQAQTLFGPWVPIFKGIDHAIGTNTPAANAMTSNLQVVNALRVDLSDPDIQLFTTPRNSNYSVNWYETAGYTTTNFLKNHGLQVVINANYFHDPGTSDTESPSYTLAQGTPFDVIGLLISQGVVVSAQESSVYPASFLFTTNNHATFVPTNWPPVSNIGAYNAVSGLYTVLANGINVGSNYIGSSDFAHQVNPRTAFGLSQDRRYLYMLTIDGRQSGYSDGAWDWETAAWLLRVGAWDGANMDGGGSTCMAMQDTTGQPIELNHDSAAAGYGVERTVGSHLGIWAKPVPGFINDIVALPDDTAATITWTTLQPATTQVQYGLTTNLGSFSTLSQAMVANHAALLTNLSPATPYYFQVIANTGTSQYASSNYVFVTTNYVTSSLLFDLSNTWTYTTTDLDGTNWTVPGYDDSGWDASGPGLFWVDALGPDPNIPVPQLTEMPADPNTGYPYSAYSFRTHFTFTNYLTPSSLLSTAYVAAGAVFYLNGAELYRVRMPANPTPIFNATLATGYPGSNSVDPGNAVSADVFSVSGDLITNLILGDNVLAVEVHNWNANGSYATFGLALESIEPFASNPQLNIQATNGSLTLSWNRGGFTLEQADSPLGPWSDVPGPVVSSPFTTSFSGAGRFYRLMK